MINRTTSTTNLEEMTRCCNRKRVTFEDNGRKCKSYLCGCQQSRSTSDEQITCNTVGTSTREACIDHVTQTVDNNENDC